MKINPYLLINQFKEVRVLQINFNNRIFLRLKVLNFKTLIQEKHMKYNLKA